MPSPRRRKTNPFTPRGRRVQTSEELQSFQVPSPRRSTTCVTPSEVVAFSPQVFQNVNAATPSRPLACEPVRLAPLLLNQPPQNLNAAPERRVVHQFALVPRSIYPPEVLRHQRVHLITRHELEGGADPLKPTQAVRRHLPALPQLEEVVFVQVRFQLPTEALRRVSEEPARHREGEQVVLFQVLVEDLLPLLGKQAPQVLLVLGLEISAQGQQLLLCARVALSLRARPLQQTYDLLLPSHERVLFLFGLIHLGALRRGFARSASHPVDLAPFSWSTDRLATPSFPSWSGPASLLRSLGPRPAPFLIFALPFASWFVAHADISKGGTNKIRWVGG